MRGAEGPTSVQSSDSERLGIASRRERGRGRTPGVGDRAHGPGEADRGLHTQQTQPQ